MTDREAVLHQMLQESERVCPAFRTGQRPQPVDRRKRVNGEDSEISTSTRQTVAFSGGFDRRKGRKALTRAQQQQVILRCRALSRDHGVCRLCGIDALALWVAIEYVRRQIEANRPSWDCAFQSFLFVIGKRASRFPKQLWDADHIVPVIEGGSDELENVRTLCLSCHWAETNKLVERRKKKSTAGLP